LYKRYAAGAELSSQAFQGCGCTNAMRSASAAPGQQKSPGMCYGLSIGNLECVLLLIDDELLDFFNQDICLVAVNLHLDRLAEIKAEDTHD
jgi:hypothetical protein